MSLWKWKKNINIVMAYKLNQMLKLYISVICLIASTITFAQNGNEITYESSVERMVETYNKQNLSKTTHSGWTVVLHNSKSRTEIESTKTKFLSKYDNWCDWEYKNPYYVLRAGVFQTKLEAERMLYLVKHDFPLSYPVQYHNFESNAILSQ